MPDIAYVNGQFSPLESATISINDRGLQFGDAVYEVICTVDGKPFLFEEHFVRLRQSCHLLGIAADEQINELPNFISKGIEDCGYPECLVYIQITRGVQLRNYLFDPTVKPTIIVTFREYIPTLNDDNREAGVKVILRPDPRWSYCHVKSVSRLSNVLVKNEADDQGAFEAIFYKHEGVVTEASSASLFIVANDALITHPSNTAVLDGVTRRFIINHVVPELGLRVEEREFSVEELQSAQEVFLSTTTYVVMPVVSIESERVGTGTPGPISRKVFEAFQRKQAELVRVAA